MGKRESPSDSGSQFIKISEVPGFSIFKSSKISKAISKTVKKQENALTAFQVVCWIIAFVALIILILDFVKVIDITPERLAIIGVIVELIIIPFSRKLKILGFEFESLKEKKKENE